MNEYDDLFFPKPNKNPLDSKPSPENKDEPSMIDFIQSKMKNVWLVLLYIVATILMSGVAMFLLRDAYPNEETLLQNIEVVQDFTFTVETAPDGVGYQLLLNGQIRNNNLISLLAYTIDFEFYNVDGTRIGVQRVTKNDFEANSVWSIEAYQILFIEEPITFSIESGLRLPTTWTILLIFSQSILLSILFFVIDWKHLKHAFRSFYQRLGYHLGITLLGFVFVIAVLILSQYILRLFDVTDTPNNELAIQSLFEPNVRNLILLFFTLCVFTPIVEEVVFRKVLFGLIEPKFGPWPAIIGSSLIFGIMHVTSDAIIQVIPYFMMGFVFGYIYHYTKKNIVVTMGMHFLNNFFVFIVYVAPLILGGLLTTS